MKLSFFDDVAEKQSLDFLDDWILENPKNKQTEFRVNVIQKAKSGKGYCLKTDCFMVFLFKNSKLCKQIIEAMQAYVSRAEGGFPLYVVLNKPNKKDYKLAVDRDAAITWLEVGNDYTVSEEYATSKAPESNPFL